MLIILGVVGLVSVLGCCLVGGVGVIGVYALRTARHRTAEEEFYAENERDWALQAKEERAIDPEEAQRRRMKRDADDQRDEELRRKADEEAMARFKEQERQELAERAAAEAREREGANRARLARLNRPLADIKLPTPVDGTGTLQVNRAKSGTLTWASLPLAAGGQPQPGNAPTIAGAVWAEDGSAFCAVTRQGLLRRISYPDLRELRKIDLKQTCSDLALCKQGLLLALPELQELWIANPDTLAIIKRFGVAHLARALTAPKLGLAYLYAYEGDGPREANGPPFRLNLDNGNMSAMVLSHEGKVPLSAPGFGYAALSPDGNALFADGGNLVRYRIDDTKLVLTASSHKGMGGGHKEGVCISPDGEWVCFPTGGGNDDANYATYLYRTSDLSKPASILKQGAYPTIVGFDVVGKRVFSQNHDHPLLIFDLKGKKQSEHRLDGRGDHDVKQYAARPSDGKALLLRTREQLFLIEFSE